jgi:DNA-binding XRE family transcriptional regulator
MRCSRLSEKGRRLLAGMCNYTYTGLVTDLATIAGLTRPGDSIRERRIELGWTQAELAGHAGVAQADISRIENGRLDARWSTIHRLSAALEATDVASKPSLANGGRDRSSPKRTGKRWTPKGPTVAIESSDA